MSSKPDDSHASEPEAPKPPQPPQPSQPGLEVVDYSAEDAALEASAIALSNQEEPRIEFHFRRWWGFELHCNQRALELVNGLRDLVLNVVSQFMPMPVSVLISVYIAARGLLINRIAGGQGARLVSPWVAPLMLTPRRLFGSDPPRPPHDTALRWTVFDTNGPTPEWSTPEVFPDHHSAVAPSLAAFGDQIFCAYRGGVGDENLWYTIYDSETGWTDARLFQQSQRSSSSPALVVYRGVLYCFHRGDSHDEQMHVSMWRHGQWNRVLTFANQGGPGSSASGPAVMVMDDRIVVVYRGPTGDERLYWTSFASSLTQGPAQTIHHGLARSAVSPAVAMLDGRLVCFYRGAGSDEALRSMRFDGHNWTEPESIAGASAHAPAMVAFDNLLYYVIRPRVVGIPLPLHYLHFPSESWTSMQPFTHNQSSSNQPGLVVYRDQHTESDRKTQIMCVYRGTGGG